MSGKKADRDDVGDGVPGAGSGPKRGKRSQVLIRVDQEVRDALEAEAERVGSSLSSIAERWIANGQNGDFVQRAGGLAPAVALDRLAGVSTRVAEVFGDPTADAHARRILLAAWQETLRSALPASTGRSALWSAVQEAQQDIVDQCRALLQAVAALDEADPVVQVMLARTISDPDFKLDGLADNPSLNAFATHLAAPKVPLITPVAKIVDAGTADLSSIVMVRFLLERADEAGDGAAEARMALAAALDAYVHAFEAWRYDGILAEEKGKALAKGFIAALKQADAASGSAA